jgi:hypothetical protein
MGMSAVEGRINGASQPGSQSPTQAAEPQAGNTSQAQGPSGQAAGANNLSPSASGQAAEKVLGERSGSSQ